MFFVRFWGVRGSIPVPGPSTLEFGGNTTCVEVRAGGELLIFDAGTGARVLGNALAEQGPVRAHMFFSHMHWDHIQGFPFFLPAFVPGNHFDLFGAQKLCTSLAEVLSGQMNYPNFPVSLEQMDSEMVFRDLDDDEVVTPGEARVTHALLRHPGGVISYRVDYRGRALVFATDTEHTDLGADPALVELARGADLLIYDAMYTPEEYAGSDRSPSRRGWGHSTWAAGVEVAQAARVGRLVLFHHDPDHDDATVRAIEKAAQRVRPGTVAAREGLVLDLEPRAQQVEDRPEPSVAR